MILEVDDFVLAGVPLDLLEVLLFVQGLSDAYKDMVAQELIHRVRIDLVVDAFAFDGQY